MLQTAFRPSCMNRAPVFQWHKRFKEGRDDEKCGRSKEVRTPELIGQIKNFMDKDRHVSIRTISAQFGVSVGTVHNISRGTEDAEDFHEVCLKGAQRRSERLCHDSWAMVELINSDPAVLDALVTCDERRPDRANPPINF